MLLAHLQAGHAPTQAAEPSSSEDNVPLSQHYGLTPAASRQRRSMRGAAAAKAGAKEVTARSRSCSVAATEDGATEVDADVDAGGALGVRPAEGLGGCRM